MKPLSLLIVRSVVLAGFILVSALAITLAQTGQQKPLPTAPLEQYDDPPAPSVISVNPAAPSPTPTPTSPSPSPGGTPTPGGTPSPTCCMFNGTVSTSCQYNAAS